MFVTIQDSTRHVLDSLISEYRAKCKGRDREMVQPALDLLLDASAVCQTDTDAKNYLRERHSQYIDAYLDAKHLPSPWWNLAQRIRNTLALRRATRTMLMAGATSNWFNLASRVGRQNERRAWNALNPQDS